MPACIIDIEKVSTRFLVVDHAQPDPSLNPTACSMVQIGARPARAHSELAQALLMRGQGFQRDIRVGGWVGGTAVRTAAGLSYASHSLTS